MYLYSNLSNENQQLKNLAVTLLILLILVIIRNWYNLYKKRSFRKKNKKNEAQLKASLLNIAVYEKELQKINSLEKSLEMKQSELFLLQQKTKEQEEAFNTTLNEKNKEIAKQKSELNHQQKAYDRYVNYKNVEANNTRLGAHFIKNVISQIYEDLEDTKLNYKSFLGIHYTFNINKAQYNLPSLKALKNIFKLLDYNVSALHKEKTNIDDELIHIELFLDLIKYLKPNTKIELKNTLTKSQRSLIKIKPTLFFPFLENALKHGSLNQEAAFISIILKEDTNKQLSYCLINSSEQRIKQTHQMSQSSNFGLNALQQLLNAYYPNSTLEHKPLPNDQYLSKLTLSLN